jgi:hypothetical protein
LELALRHTNAEVFMANLQRRPSGIYLARLVFPPRLQAPVGLTEFIASTGSRNLPTANVIASEKLALWRDHRLPHNTRRDRHQEMMRHA